MVIATDNENVVENIFSSYEARIQNVESLFEAANQILQGFQDTVLDTRQEREKINGQLKNSLAQNGSLRRKDFDKMMSVISSHQDQEEQAVRDLLKKYLEEQTSLVQELRECYKNFTDALAKGEPQRVKEFHAVIIGIFARQEQKREKVICKLKEFQKEQQETAQMFKNLLAKGRELRTSDLKSMLAEFKRQRKERIACQERRRQKVKDMLGEFKAKRAETERARFVEQQET